MTTSARPHQLGAFLKARRAELSPRAVGLPEGAGRRRVRGLRREEVALLAAVSTDHYTRLEQGRARASASVLTTLARVLRLDHAQRAYLYELAGSRPSRPARRAATRVQPHLRRLLGEFTTAPAVVLGRRMDVLAWNPLAAALITDFAAIPRRDRNYLRLLFTDPRMRELYRDWQHIAHTCVTQLRHEAARDPDTPGLAVLVGELSLRDSDFSRWWAARDATVRAARATELRHPTVGALTLECDTFVSTGTGQQLVLWSAPSGSPAHDALRILSSWSGTTTDGGDVAGGTSGSGAPA